MDQLYERHRLAAQATGDTVTIDDMTKKIGNSGPGFGVSAGIGRVTSCSEAKQHSFAAGSGLSPNTAPPRTDCSEARELAAEEAARSRKSNLG